MLNGTEQTPFAVPIRRNHVHELYLDYEAALLGFANVELDPLEEKNIWLSSGAQHPWWPSQKTPATPWEARIDELELKQAA